MALATLAHVAGGETAPGLALLLVLALPLAAVSLWLTRRQRGPVAIAATLGVAQWVLHQVFMGASTMPATPAMLGAGTDIHAAHVHTTVAPLGVEPVGRLVLLPGPAMTVAHVVAALALALLLAHGERMLALLVAVVDLLVRPRVLVDAAAPAPWTPALVAGPQWTPRPWSVVAAVGRRGPP